MIERLRLNQFYGSPTAIRLLLKSGDSWVKKYDRSSLRVLGTGKIYMLFRVKINRVENFVVIFVLLYICCCYCSVRSIEIT